MLTRPVCNRRLADKVPKVLYLRFLRAMHSRDFAQALDDLHRYFDMFATGGINVQYAVLNLAALHLHFGHLEEAMHAINETVRVAQQSNDATALAFAVAWLLRVVQAQNGTRTTRRTASHDAKEEERMLRRCFSCASEEELPHLVSSPISVGLSHVLRHMYEFVGHSSTCNRMGLVSFLSLPRVFASIRRASPRLLVAGMFSRWGYQGPLAAGSEPTPTRRM